MLYILYSKNLIVECSIVSCPSSFQFEDLASTNVRSSFVSFLLLFPFLWSKTPHACGFSTMIDYHYYKL